MTAPAPAPPRVENSDLVVLREYRRLNEMNRALVSVLHGAPLRSRCENEKGFGTVKWIAAVEFVHDFADLGAGLVVVLLIWRF